MIRKWPHFVGTGWLPEWTWNWTSREVTKQRSALHDALLAILDRTEITDDNINILEENIWVVSLQELLDVVKSEKLQADREATDKHVNRYVNDVRSRVIQSLVKLWIRYALSDKKTISPDMLWWDIREITINHSMIATLRKQTNN